MTATAQPGVRLIPCRTDDAFRHDGALQTVNGEPRCPFCVRVISGFGYPVVVADIEYWPQFGPGQVSS